MRTIIRGVFMEFILSVLSGIISGIVASIIINIYLRNKKPKIEISDNIARNPENEYRIKIINKSHFYVTNMIIQARLISLSTGNGGNIYSSKVIDVKQSLIYLIDPYSKDDKNAPYAIRIGISKKLDQYWTDDSNTYLKVIVYCSNEWNTASKVYTKEYYKKNQAIKDGDFDCGRSMRVFND